MRRSLVAIACVIALGSIARAQQPVFHDALLDHLAGTWVLQGTIAGKQTTHDITAEWVLEHQYLRLHEVSSEKKDSDRPAYEAMVFIGWEQTKNEYVCFWLDDFGGGFDSTIGRGKRGGSEIELLFNYPSGPFHTTFAYDAQSDSWLMRMDSEQKGQRKPFARTKLTRK